MTAMALTSLPRPQRLPQTSSSKPRRAQHRAPVSLLKWLRLLQALTAPVLLVLTRRRSLLSATLSSSRRANRCAQPWTAPQQGLVLFSRHKVGTSALGDCLCPPARLLCTRKQGLHQDGGVTTVCCIATPFMQSCIGCQGQCHTACLTWKLT